MVEKEKKQIIFLESHKIFIALEFLKQEETECLTEYGKGLLTGLIDNTSQHKIPVVPLEYYNKLEEKYNELLASKKTSNKRGSYKKKEEKKRFWQSKKK